MSKDLNKGELFSDELLKEIKDKFYNVDSDPRKGTRLFFDNAGGSFRLKSALEVFQEIDSLPDCPERVHDTALYLQKIQEDGTNDIRTILNVKNGSIVTSLTASQVMFQIVGTIAENIPGTNMVTTVLEHPSAFDSMKYYADKTNKELRVIKTNTVTGGVDVEEVAKLIDKDTCVLSIMYASNISGAILDIESIVREARKIKSDLYIIVDAVQHAPHGVIDLEKTPVDAMNFAPYKFFGVRGSGIAYVSDRVASMPHHRLLAKQPNEWELGSSAPAQFAVITEIVNYVCWIGSKYIESKERRELFVEGMNRIKLHERALMYRMLNGTSEMPGLRNMKGASVFLDYEDLTTRDLIMAMGIDNLDYTQAVREYEKLGVIVYERVATSLYSKRMLESFGLEGAIRISPLHCHAPEDIDKFLKITEKLASNVIK
ncbi:aminotransferase class V-fold PLP-dependent enzyme [Clostridium sp. PL3]|uniref:Aminotransferase class V-fold PLP-dependent enzyme n=1 Tax=Clostridium thailandense TaxID=2794346 RepID=A0A949U0F4_9CLOT|nr:aminotransferase class V-fold PLP-dependent enzyme [Clostridium thailandense]MBV7275146.1 aminotransferase class V-fold PLP-dependent enzyme [Clostridium thailandense]